MSSSYNGWPASEDPAAIDIDRGFAPAGIAFPGGARSGDVSTVLGYVAAQFFARVEPPLIDPDTGQPGYGCWGYNYRANVNNPSTLSCHSSGTALDISAPAHPNGAGGTFSDAQRATIYEILGECAGAVQWGGDYTGTLDEMHFEIIVDADYLAQVATSLGPYQPDEMEWTDMASKEEVQQAVSDAITAQLEQIGIAVWSTHIRDNAAGGQDLGSTLLAAAADDAHAAATR